MLISNYKILYIRLVSEVRSKIKKAEGRVWLIISDPDCRTRNVELKNILYNL